MHFLLIISHDSSFAPTADLVGEIIGWIRSMAALGIRVAGNPLRPAAEAVTVRVRDGEVILSAGPFSRSREQMCAYELIQCASLDDAVEIAGKHPMATAATIEVRPVWSQLSGA